MPGSLREGRRTQEAPTLILFPFLQGQSCTTHVAPCTLPLCPITGVISKISPPGALETWPGEHI